MHKLSETRLRHVQVVLNEKTLKLSQILILTSCHKFLSLHLCKTELVDIFYLFFILKFCIVPDNFVQCSDYFAKVFIKQKIWLNQIV